MMRGLQTMSHDAAIVRLPNWVEWIVGVSPEPRPGFVTFRPVAVQVYDGAVNRVWAGAECAPRDEAFRAAVTYVLATLDEADDPEDGDATEDKYGRLSRLRPDQCPASKIDRRGTA